MLEALQADGKIELDAIGYNEAELLRLTEQVSENFAEDTSDPPRLDRLKKIKCPKCGHEFTRYE